MEAAEVEAAVAVAVMGMVATEVAAAAAAGRADSAAVLATRSRPSSESIPSQPHRELRMRAWVRRALSCAE